MTASSAALGMPSEEEIGKTLAYYFSGNLTPCMSGDQRNLLSPLQRLSLVDAVKDVLALIRPAFEAVEARGHNAHLALKEERALADAAERRALSAEAKLVQAVEAIRSHIQPQGDGRHSDDYMTGWAAGANYTAEQNRAAIIALEGKEG